MGETNMKALDLFCGCGGFSEGFRQAGFTIVEGYDWWSVAVCTYTQNFDGAGVKKDITLYTLKLFPPVDVIIGSPPCVNFSTANTSADLREGLLLVYRFLEVVCYLKPKYWVMENVPQIAKLMPKAIAPQRLVLNSADFGVPQTRKRFFIGDFPKPKPSHSKYNTLDKLSIWVSMRQALKDVPKGETAHAPKHVFEKHKHHFHNILNDVDLDKPCRTILARESSNTGLSTIYVPDGEGHRRLSIPEVKRLMGFPDSFVLTGNTPDKYKQLGNAVCPPVAKAIAESILRGEVKG